MLIIAGDEDKSAPLTGCEFILGQLGSKSKSLEVLKGVGHWHCVEAGDEVARFVSAFCERVW
jgi:pimeloyl-ACP methyl ester carboxylesterase